ncbi:STAS domain-containing protein [Ottowia thiooxydans]|uniref:STAS domain-containing protein n=1 Tax=Ottowia thiooxydans TaxID=219182 RepID=UPI00041BB204|nr:STAS domain-containing protein [Ottowia thiooxydans]
MSKDPGSSGKGGLLSKVVRFVSSPTTHWADLDRPEATSEENDSRLALKEMIERKRRNDFVRNREFDLLRKARRRETPTVQELGVSSSLSQNSEFANTGERARTLKKIDEIEKQMSSAWLRHKSESPSAQSPESSSPQATPVSTQVSAAHSASGEPTTIAPGISMTRAFAPTINFEAPTPEKTELLSAEPAPYATEDLPPLLDMLGEHTPVSQALGSVSADLEGPGNAKQEPEVEEAAIRFANGDTAGAESGLRELLRDADPLNQSQDTWLTLFDLYRATGEQGKFDDAAVDFASRFGRSAPQWALGPLLSSQNAALLPQETGTPSNALAHWVAPSVLGVQSVAALNATLGRHAPPWRVDWRYLKVVEPAALPVFTEALQRWADTSARFKFIGGETLIQLLVDNSPTDDRSVDPMWWVARLALLRVLNEMDEFELVALKYCVTYEVSPPAWQEPSNVFTAMTSDGESILGVDDGRDAPQGAPETLGVTDLSPLAMGELANQGVLKSELKGELLGDAELVLRDLDIAEGVVSIEFNCSHLERVDFGAAGTLLNWATTQQEQGRQVVFKHVNRLVAAFFGVVGISEVARVRLRKD